MEKIVHPCFEIDGCGYRFHLPIAPKCNTKCNFCKKGVSEFEKRPGVAKKVLSLEEIDGFMQENISQFPQCKIIGIAGPGDPLANAEVLFRAFNMVDEKYPDFKKCMCTNGFLLPDYRKKFLDAKLDYITLTINSRNPKTIAKIYDFLEYKGKVYRGIEMGNLICKLQEEALNIVSEQKNIKLKINIVVIPDINDSELRNIIDFLRKYEVHIFNLIPLLNVKGTKFENVSKMSQNELENLKKNMKKIFPDVRFKNNCRKCRADDCGYIGSKK